MGDAAGRRRAILSGVGAALLFGGWAIFANRRYPAGDIARAALAQAALSALSTTAAVLLLEFLFNRPRNLIARACLAGLGTPLAILATMAGVHAIAGTPRLLATIAPSLVSGTIFCLVYTAGLVGASRAAVATPDPSRAA